MSFERLDKFLCHSEARNLLSLAAFPAVSCFGTAASKPYVLASSDCFGLAMMQCLAYFLRSQIVTSKSVGES